MTTLVQSESDALDRGDRPVAETRSGRVRGYVDDGVLVFKGLPYGAPTGGAHRFMPPRPVQPWTGVREATEYGDQSPQPPNPMGGPLASLAMPDNYSEDCLNLNVWTPGLDDGKRPVMVWFHGGGFSLTSASVEAYDGVRLANKGDVVVVTVNHRLNVFGYLYLADLAGNRFADSGNTGQLDLIAALEWVRDNITAFGGDPGRVMIFGQSGGGSKVANLLAAPAAKGLFHRAALQSGPGLTSRTPEHSTAHAKDLLAAMGLSAQAAESLQSAPADQLLSALATLSPPLGMGLGAVVDGRTLSRHPFTPDAPAISADIPILLGTNTTEATTLGAPPKAFAADWTSLPGLLSESLPGVDAAALIAQWRALQPQASAAEVFFQIESERRLGHALRAVADRKAAQNAAPAYFYRLEWMSPALGGVFGAFHGLDLAMVFDNIAKAPSMVGDAAAEAQGVADAMSAAWIAFAHSGSPNAPGLPHWPAHDPARRPTMVFDVDTRLVDDPRRGEREIIASLSPAN